MYSRAASFLHVRRQAHLVENANSEVLQVDDSIDAIIDLKYFAVGVLYKMGLSPDMQKACCTAVHSANMEKKLGTVAKRAVEGAADAVKPEGWVSPEERIIEILDTFGA